ncbi:thiamine phosphate synthase [Candidatus Binatia bacterium]|nr:thiamine phosphate synthase [Candidatus Binatia bacterium]
MLDTTGELAPLRVLLDALVQARPPWLQLRWKNAAGGPLLELACEVVQRAAAAGCRVIVNDRLDVALASGAAGVHLGQDDLPLDAARRVAGDRLVIGVSTHDVAEARAAEDGGADYVGFGPMFPTTSKADALTPRTLDGLRAVRAAIRIPIVAIGGIGPASAHAILDAGADAVAMISALATSPDPTELCARILALPRRT